MNQSEASTKIAPSQPQLWLTNANVKEPVGGKLFW